MTQHIVFLIRRFIIIALVTACTMSPISQTMGYYLLTVVNFAYVLTVQPFDSSVLNRSEIMNETTVFFASYHLFCFTEYMEDVEREEDVGWSIIFLITINIGLNMSIFVYVVFNLTKLRCKRKIAFEAASKRAAANRQSKLDATKDQIVPAKLKSGAEGANQGVTGLIEAKLKEPLEPVQESDNESSSMMSVNQARPLKAKIMSQNGKIWQPEEEDKA